VLIVLKSESLNLLETLEPVKACNGIVLPLPLPRFLTSVKWNKKSIPGSNIIYLTLLSKSITISGQYSGKHVKVSDPGRVCGTSPEFISAD
jgi:hypothetical protein